VEAFGQCQDWIKKNLPNVERVAVSSTAHAAELAGKEKDSAAIASSVCAEVYSLNTIASQIQDLKSRFNVTSQIDD
jgi:chorismate mutase/prephenate dehydratase